MMKRPRRQRVDAHVAALPPDARLYASIIAEGEIRYGAEIGPPIDRTGRLEAYGLLLGYLADVMPITMGVVLRHEALVRLMRAAKITDNDVWMAAIALEFDMVMVTDDSPFDRVPGLVVENWAAG
jgi:predicted nucleic acid-binding protein